MARAGELPTPQFKKGQALAQGQAQAVNQMAQSLPAAAPTPGIDEQNQYQPQSPAEQFLFGPTNRPSEPITAGAPFGPGASVMFNSDLNILQNVAQQVLSDPNAGKDSKVWAARALAGD